MAELKSTRDAYGEALVELGRMDPRIVVLDADVSKATKTDRFAKEFPQRFINCGCAEANMMAVAAGISLSGFIPFASAMAVFASLRALDQIRNTICYPGITVVVAATHGGITVGEDGPSHQAIEDIAVMRSLPNMTVIVPADAPQTRKAVLAAAMHHGPVYLRMGRPPVPSVTGADDDFQIGTAQVLRRGSHVAIVACGVMVAEALRAADALEKESVSAMVLNVHTVKPMDELAVVRAAQTTRGIVTAEEGVLMGGLGSAVVEVLSRHGVRTPVRMIGVRDEFAESGSPEALREKYGLTSEDIVREVLAMQQSESR
ncbi:MAG: transketolase family protein [Spirochaetes bacterium]|nr:transketolase family protein [Spirochaetota bacterium]